MRLAAAGRAAAGGPAHNLNFKLKRHAASPSQAQGLRLRPPPPAMVVTGSESVGPAAAPAGHWQLEARAAWSES